MKIQIVIDRISIGFIYIFLFLFLGLIGFFPLWSQAHGGFQKQAGDTIVYVSQNPISPLVGEKVKITFVLKRGLNEPLKNLDVTLSIIDTFYGDATRDKTILTDKKITDANGAFELEYTFTKENYFDIDLEFVDLVTGELQDVGFLVQQRLPDGAKVIEIEKEIKVINWKQLVLAGIIGFCVGLGAINFTKKIPFS